MKKFIIAVIFIIWIALFLFSHHLLGEKEELVIKDAKREIMEEDKTVYITENGEKYHQASCKNLGIRFKEVPKSEAERAKIPPCKACN